MSSPPSAVLELDRHVDDCIFQNAQGLFNLLDGCMVGARARHVESHVEDGPPVRRFVVCPLSVSMI